MTIPFDGQPNLEGPRLALRPMQPQDWDELFAVAADPAIWAVHPAWDRYTEPVFREYFEEGLQSGGALVVLDRSTGRIIGASRYASRYAGPGEIEIGWTFLSRDYWGGPANRELKRLMLRHAFRFVDTVMFRIGSDNVRSRRAMEKIGGVLTGRAQAASAGGRAITNVVYTISARDFAASSLDLEAE